MTTTQPAGLVVLTIAETADTSGTPWTEEHMGFALEQINDDGSETYHLDLDFALLPRHQVDGVSTLLNEDYLGSDWADGLTWMFYARAADGSGDDCLVTGNDTDSFSESCTDTAR